VFGFRTNGVVDVHDRLWMLARQRRQSVSAVVNDLLDKSLPEVGGEEGRVVAEPRRSLSMASRAFTAERSLP
jgi:hypothetical protein